MGDFEWDSSLATGNEAIDSQHQGLFRLSAGLAAAAESDDAGSQAVTDAVWELTDYVVQHFADEEAMMEASGYPVLGLHRSLHEQLTADVMALAQKVFASDEVDGAKLAAFLAGWLRGHIRGEDMAFVRTLNEAG